MEHGLFERNHSTRPKFKPNNKSEVSLMLFWAEEQGQRQVSKHNKRWSGYDYVEVSSYLPRRNFLHQRGSS